MKKTTIIILTIIALSASGYYFRWHINTFYYNLVNNHFETGDKIYLGGDIFNDEHASMVDLYRVLRPLTEEDINKLSINNYEKILKKKSLDPNAKPYAIHINKYFSESDLRAAKSSFVGLYQGKEVLNMKIGDEIVFSNFYRIEPNQKVLTDTHYDDELPNNYTWANNQLYIFATDVSDKDVLGTKK